MDRIPRKETPQATSWEMTNENSTHNLSSQNQGYGEQYVYSPPPAQLKPSKGLFAKLGQLESETWLVEICSMGVSLLATALIIIYLRRYDGEPYPDLPQNITLNAVLSVAMTIIVVTIGIPLSSGLGQLNWIRARQAPVSLSSMNTMDQGTRGAWGGIRVILTWAGGPIGALGALAAVLAVAVPPLAQQSILLTREQDILAFEQPTISRCNGSEGFHPIARTKTVNSTHVIGGTTTIALNGVPPSIIGEYYSSAYNNYVNTSFHKGFAICSGNCTWKPFVTLSLCSKCVNITESLVKSTDAESKVDTWRLPGMGDSTTAVTSFLTYNIFDTKYSNRIHSSFATALLFASAENSKGGARAMECALSFCVQTISASMVNGLLYEDILESYDFDNQTITGPTRNITIKPPVPAIPNSPFTQPISLDLTNPDWIGGEIKFQGKFGPIITNGSSNFLVFKTRGLGNLTETMNNVAMGMGRAFRVECPGGAQKETGVATHDVLIVKIRWYWLVAPLLVEALGLIFLLAIMVMNIRSRARLWKTSFLAPCFHGMKLENSSQPMSLEKIHEMASITSVKVQLQDDPSGGGARSRLRY